MKRSFFIFLGVLVMAVSAGAGEGASPAADAKQKKGLPQILNESIQGDLPQIKACYQKSQPTKRGPSGRVITKFVIGPNGNVSSASVESTTLNNKVVEDCLVEELKKIHFNELSGGGAVEVSYPFSFGPQKKGKKKDTAG